MLPIIFGLLPVFLLFAVGVASPGPSNMTIMRNALRYGRFEGIMTAFGIVTGSAVWGIMAVTSVGVVIAKNVLITKILGIAGGFYLCYLGWKAFKASTPKELNGKDLNKFVPSYWRLYMEGLMLHLTNPKAIFVWLSTITLGTSLTSDFNSSSTPLLILTGCVFIALIIFCSYAFFFSFPFFCKIYMQKAKDINLVLSATYVSMGGVLIYKMLSEYL